MTRFFLKLYDLFLSRRPLLWTLFAVLCVGLGVAASTIRFSENVSDFLPADSHNERVNWAYSHIGSANKIVITVSMADSAAQPDRDLLIEAVDSLVARIGSGTTADHINSLMYCVDRESIAAISNFVTSNMAYYLTDEQYSSIDSLLGYDAIRARLESVKGLLMSPASAVIKSSLVSDPLMFSGEQLQQLQGFKLNDKFQLIDDYIFIDNPLSAVVTLDSKYSVADTRGGKLLVESIDADIDAVESRFEGRVAIEPFGSSYIAQSNSSQIKRDSIVSIVIALVLIVLLLALFFRDVRSIAVVAASIAFGALFSFGLTALIAGKVSLVAVGAGSIIVGIAANYPLHLVSHIKQGYSVRESLIDIVSPLTTGNITTVGAFLSLLFISSPAMRDLGLFASLLLVGTILFVLLFAPHLMGRKGLKRTGVPSWGGFTEVKIERNRWVVLAVVVITVVLSFFDQRVHFDANMNSINYMTDRQRQTMGRMLDMVQGSQHVTYFTVEGSSIDQALTRYERVRPRLDSVVGCDERLYSVSGIGGFLPSESRQSERTEQWNSFWSSRREKFLSNFERAARDAGFREGAFGRFEHIVAEDYAPKPIAEFESVMHNMTSNYLIDDGDRAAVLTMVACNPASAVSVEESLDKLDSDAFAFDSGSVTRRMVALLSADFDWVLYVCGFIVLLLLTVLLGRLELSLISFLPLTISWIWILGIMGAAGLGFNIVNIILATFIFGMGDDYTIFITEGLVYEYAYGRKMLATYKSTVTLSALIMFVGIGSLIVARHPAMRSLAEVTIVGMFSVVVMAYIIPPFFFRWLTLKHGKRREEPITLRNLLSTVGAFTFFLFGSLFITLAGFVLLTIGGRTARHKLAYHRLIKRVARLTFNNVFHTRHTVELNGERFERPSVIISNHQSHLDLMALLMLTERMIVITNRWVWHSPFYGLLIRYADFCPIDNMLTDDMSHIEAMIAEGYSVLIFPEATRSEDCSILRFHRGAFYLAEKYSLDILPVYLHGVGHVLPKSDLLLRKGLMSVEVGERITPSDTRFGDNYVQRTKAVRALYVERYAAMVDRFETPDYFADRVIHNYIYKGAAVEREVRRSLRLNHNYRLLIDSLPKQGRVLIDMDDYGQVALLAALVRKNLSVDCLMADDLKRDMAVGCVSVPSNLGFIDRRDPDVCYDRVVDADSAVAVGQGDNCELQTADRG